MSISLLIAVVILSAIVPTAIAQRFFQPRLDEQDEAFAAVESRPRLRPGAEPEAEAGV